MFKQVNFPPNIYLFVCDVCNMFQWSWDIVLHNNIPTSLELGLYKHYIYM